MQRSSLRDIEKTLVNLWMNRTARAEFIEKNICELDPELAKQIDKDGVELYAGLLNYGHQDVMSSIYPLCAKVIGGRWEQIVDDYLEVHPPHHFNLNRTAAHFPSFIATYSESLLHRCPYLIDLADYEWVELEMIEHDGIAPTSQLENLDSPEQFARFGPIINPALKVRTYQYPVISIAERLESGKRKAGKVNAKQSHVVIYRDPAINRCRFLEVGPTAAAILSRVIEETAEHRVCTYNELMTLAVSMSAADPQKTIADFLGLVEQLQTDRLFLGNHSQN